MTLALQRSENFNRDFDLQYRWYLEQAGEAVAERYLQALLSTLRLVRMHPDLGRQRNFRHPALRSMRSFRLASPFEVHLIFYRHDAGQLFAERLMHGARDLPRRLVEPPEAAPG